MGQLADFLAEWRAQIAEYGISQPFVTMDLTIVDRLEQRLPSCAISSALVSALDQKARSLRQVMDYQGWLPVYEAYAEAKVGLRLLETGRPVVRIVPPKDENGRTLPRPDFRISIDGRDFYIEVKSLHARGGEENYQRSMERGFDTIVDLDERMGSGRVAMGETVIQPHRRHLVTDYIPRSRREVGHDLRTNRAAADDPALHGRSNYDPSSNRQIIETLIGREVDHVKPGQFDQGDTVLAIELSLLPLRSSVGNELYRTYPDPHESVATSGILWNLAFGAEGSDIFRPVEFAGASNIDGQLNAAGLLSPDQRRYVKGVWIVTGNQAGWLVRSTDEATVQPLLATLPAPGNNELNELWCREHLTPRAIAELKTMIDVKAFELSRMREVEQTDGSPEGDWLLAKEHLGIPACAPV
jgi:hypothetical protein